MYVAVLVGHWGSAGWGCAGAVEEDSSNPATAPTINNPQLRNLQFAPHPAGRGGSTRGGYSPPLRLRNYVPSSYSTAVKIYAVFFSQRSSSN